MFKIYTAEEIEAQLPELFLKYGDNWESDRGTEYLGGYEITYRFGLDEDGWSTERVTVLYYY